MYEETFCSAFVTVVTLDIVQRPYNPPGKLFMQNAWIFALVDSETKRPCESPIYSRIEARLVVFDGLRYTHSYVLELFKRIRSESNCEANRISGILHSIQISSYKSSQHAELRLRQSILLTRLCSSISNRITSESL